MNADLDHIVPELAAPQRLSDYAVGLFDEYPSRNAAKKAIKAGLILVDGEPAETGRWLNGGEAISLAVDKRLGTKKILRMRLEVLWQDDYLAVVHKPPSIEVSGNQFRTVEHALPHNLEPSTQPDALPQPVAAHRLDHPTSGVLLVAKTRSALTGLHRQFEAQAIHKTYLAVVGGMTDKKGVIFAPIDGKDSETEYWHIASLESPRLGTLTLLHCYPHTGRRHQIRKHLSGIGHPILGDEQYAPAEFRIPGRGLYLHARSIEFDHPVTGDSLSVSSTVPGKFRRLFGDF